jgi:ABC-type nitrate/sulfonate/bicarbonate transport system substrate-binding protein
MRTFHSSPYGVLVLFFFLALSAAAGAPSRPAIAAEASNKLVVFVGPIPALDPVWMADAQGYFKQEGLDVQLRTFPSGTTALQTFKTGAGDIVYNGDLPGVSYWANTGKDYRIVAINDRDAKGYTAMVRNAIKTPQDLKGKTIATRVGSTGSWFISVFLAKNGLKPSDVTVKNLDTQVLPIALCKGDIDGFFIWQPFGQRASEICPKEVHELSTAEGYVDGYGMFGVRPKWLAEPANHDKLVRFLRALIKGKAYAKSHLDDVIAYGKAKYGVDAELTRFSAKTVHNPIGFDPLFYKDFCSLSAWMQQQRMLSAPIDYKELIDASALRQIDAKYDDMPAMACKPAS